jgi:hypothetical protein
MQGQSFCISPAVSGLSPISAPATSQTNVQVHVINIASKDLTARVRMGYSSCTSFRWSSDSGISCRFAAGFMRNFDVSASIVASVGSVTKLFSYQMPSISVLRTHLLSNSSVFGSNFGSYAVVVHRETYCTSTDLLSPQTNGTVCNATVLQADGGTITDAAVSITFASAVRMDDVVLSLLSPDRKEYVLMKNKCYGALPCGASTVVEFNFQILPFNQASAVPLEMCPSSGSYLSEDAPALRSAFMSLSAVGNWSLMVKTGSGYQNVSRSSFHFRTSALDFQIGHSFTSSLQWISDSNVVFKAPGYLLDNGIESAAGWGRSHSVAGRVSGVPFQASFKFSYPDPLVTALYTAHASTASVGTNVLGRYFANRNSNPRARLASSECGSTRWQSDTVVTCHQSPSIGSVFSVAATIQSSAVAKMTTSFLYFFAHHGTVTATAIPIVTASSTVTVLGARFGVWDASLRSRLLFTAAFGTTSSDVTIWRSDSRISIKVCPLIYVRSGIAISLASVVANASTLVFPELHLLRMTAFCKLNSPSTGAVLLTVTGKHFGYALTSLKTSVGASVCSVSRWTSDSFVSCKTTAGMYAPTLQPLASSLSPGVVGQYLCNTFGFDVPAVNATANVFANNSEVCAFNSSSGCMSGGLIQLEYSSSGFGTCSFPQFFLSLVQGSSSQKCNKSSWVSDSSVQCLYSSAPSPEFPSLKMLVEPAGAQVPIRNPYFLPAPPTLTPDTAKFRFYSNVTFPAGDDKLFQNFGTTTGFEWPDSSFVGSARYSEVIPFSVLLFLNASQFFMDKTFKPIETNIYANITVWNVADVTSSVLCDRVQYKAVSFSLPAALFWSKMATSFSFCAPLNLNATEVTLRAHIIVQNANGNTTFEASSAAFQVFCAGIASVVVTKHPASMVSAAVTYNDALSFLFKFGTTLDQVCALEGSCLLNYQIELICNDDKIMFRPLHLSDGSSSDQCVLNVTGIKFLLPQKNCAFKISVRLHATLDAVYSMSESFEVVPGAASIAALVGAGPFCASAGAIVWSIKDSSNQMCLVAQLTDSEGNNATSFTLATVKARDFLHSTSDYPIARSSSNMSSSSGLVTWCDAFSSRQQNESVVFGALVNGNVTFWTQSVVNVSLPGPAASIISKTASMVGNETLVAGGQTPRLNFSLEDAGGNLPAPVQVYLRVRVMSVSSSAPGRFASNIISMLSLLPRQGRRLHQQSNQSVFCESDSLVFFVTLSPGDVISNQISAGPDHLCRAGINTISFDIGIIIAGMFSATFANAFNVNVSVSPGVFQSFLLGFNNSTSAINSTSQTYQLIDTLEIMFLDVGLNVVTGNATMSLFCEFGAASIYPNNAFKIASNMESQPSVKAMVPPFFVFIQEWMTTLDFLIVGISSINSSVPKHPSSVVMLRLSASCFPGHRISAPFTAVFPSILTLNRLRVPTLCSMCDSSQQFSSFYHDASQCLTLRWPGLLKLVQSGQDVAVDGVLLMNQALVIEQSSAVFSMTASLIRARERNSAVCSTTIANGIAKSCKISQIVYQQSPGSDYKWLFTLHPINDLNVTLMTVILPLDGFVTVLDFGPIVHALVPGRLSFSGEPLLTLVGKFPLNAFASGFHHGPSSFLDIFNDTCVFTSIQLSKKVDIVLPANRSINSNDTITLICGPLASAASGPPLTRWMPIMNLVDGRNSTGFPLTVQSFCPQGFYIHNALSSAPLQCRQCPAVRSSTLVDDEYEIQSCLCSSGFYGSFGYGCKPCPKNVDGFNCSLRNQSQPVILPGYYILYSRMSECSEYGPKCDAIIKCPNPKACPGQKERQCLQRQDECYDSDSFGCTACCYRYYMENLKCLPCPSSRLILVLALATLFLILFAVFSSSFDFPPFVSAAQSLKVFLYSMQGFVSIRLIDIPWPPIVLNMFDFTRFFTFNFDVLRPECTVDYSPVTKLIFVLVGPFLCSSFIILMILVYTACKCRIITRSLHHERVSKLMERTHIQLMISVAQCMITSSLCLKFSNSRMMRDGSLWNALDPTMAQRSDILVLKQKIRRRAIVSQPINTYSNVSAKSAIPEDWIEMQKIVAENNIGNEFSRSAKRFRLLLASALSIFVFTFQGMIETALSTFDCKEVNGLFFLRLNPKVQCSTDDNIYVRMIAISIIGIAMYCLLLPSMAVFLLRSRWCRDVYLHDSRAYGHIFGFLTSMYTKNCSFWELAATARKFVFVVIPVLVSRVTLVQSVCMLIFLIIYTFAILTLKPMSNTSLNQIEVLSCISVIVGCFSSIFFVVEYNGAMVLSGATRDLAGLILVLICSICALFSMRLMYREYSSKLTVACGEFDVHISNPQCSHDIFRADVDAQGHLHLEMGRVYHCAHGWHV